MSHYAIPDTYEAFEFTDQDGTLHVADLALEWRFELDRDFALATIGDGPTPEVLSFVDYDEDGNQIGQPTVTLLQVASAFENHFEANPILRKRIEELCAATVADDYDSPYGRLNGTRIIR